MEVQCDCFTAEHQFVKRHQSGDVSGAVCLQPNNKLHEVSHLLIKARWKSVGRWITLTDKSTVPLILTR